MTDAAAPLDYARLGRQLALVEVGPAGQRALAASPVRFAGEPEGAALAALLHTRAGGRVDAHAERALEVPAGATPEQRLAAAAYACLEVARATLSLGAPCPSLPDALRARLDRAPLPRE